MTFAGRRGLEGVRLRPTISAGPSSVPWPRHRVRRRDEKSCQMPPRSNRAGGTTAAASPRRAVCCVAAWCCRHAGLVGSQAGEEGRAAGIANRILHVGTLEADAARGQAINVGRLDRLIAVAAEMIAEIVGDDEEYVAAVVWTSAEASDSTPNKQTIASRRRVIRPVIGCAWQRKGSSFAAAVPRSFGHFLLSFCFLIAGFFLLLRGKFFGLLGRVGRPLLAAGLDWIRHFGQPGVVELG